MKKIFLALSIALTVFTSCSKEENVESVVETQEAYINATSKTTWNYYSLSENKLVGTGEENDSDNNSWAARQDWDFALCRYAIRTNSGAATTVNAKGGIYTFTNSVAFASISALPSDAQFISDKAITSSGMSGTVTVVKSDATVISFKTNEDGSLVMPPVYLQAPVYAFRSADGNSAYKLQFTQYQDENSATGHVRFIYSPIK